MKNLSKLLAIVILGITLVSCNKEDVSKEEGIQDTEFTISEDSLYIRSYTGNTHIKLENDYLTLTFQPTSDIYHKATAKVYKYDMLKDTVFVNNVPGNAFIRLGKDDIKWLDTDLKCLTFFEDLAAYYHRKNLNY